MTSHFTSAGYNHELNEELKLHQNKAISEPIQGKFPQFDMSEEQKWKEVVDFMRKNPKLLMEMIPDEEPK